MINQEETNRRISIAKSIDDLIDISNYNHKDKFTKDLYNVTRTVSELRNIPFTILTELRNKYSYNAGNKSWMEYIDSRVKEIQPNYTGKKPWILECTSCGSKEEKPSRSSLVRSLGFAGNDDKKNGGMCYDCSMAEKRKPHPPRSKEWLLENRMKEIRRLGYDTIEEYEENIFVMGRKDTYYKSVDALSRTNLKNYNPELYKLWRENTWDGTNYETGMTIEHKTPKSVCWKERWSIEKAAHISNLDVMTQKENNQSWMDYSSKKVLVKENKFW